MDATAAAEEGGGMSIRAIHGDCREVLKTLPDASVHCCVTSPPYYALRDYQTAGQIGLEATPDAYVAELVAVFRECRRVLRSDGTLWMVLGDGYSSGGRKDRDPGRSKLHPAFEKGAYRPVDPPGVKPKDLLGIPWMVAFALRADGWWLRQDIIWSKPNPMPESVRDRCTKAHEIIFLLSKSPRYFYDAEAIREECSETSHGGPNVVPGWKNESLGQGDGNLGKWTDADKANGRNKRSVWEVATQPYS
jgi:DNA modification methylase